MRVTRSLFTYHAARSTLGIWMAQFFLPVDRLHEKSENGNEINSIDDGLGTDAGAWVWERLQTHGTRRRGDRIKRHQGLRIDAGYGLREFVFTYNESRSTLGLAQTQEARVWEQLQPRGTRRRGDRI